MSAVLLTGMSGTGKSTLLARLADRGYSTVDTDYGPWCVEVEGERIWDDALMSQLLARRWKPPLLVSGCVINQGLFYDRFAAVVLLSAPPAVIYERCATRTHNDYGKRPEERERIARDIAAVEPLLRATATHEILTTGTVDDAVAALLTILRPLGAP